MYNRMGLLKQQNALHNQYCVTCVNRKDRNAKSCKKCDIFIKFNEIGRCLLNLNKSPNDQASLKKTIDDIFLESMTEYGMILTIDRYLDLQEMGLKNSEIAAHYDIKIRSLMNGKFGRG
ncbi:hypothetical protein CD31_02660 [Lysinibacillus boronitolerans JCM 21713 = 10a = NBRC 103108]|uniref:Uncharacterized protein n=1 Tax=Lysinibacillus boronitolerans JCM 21713 = 10a = NBRC 103108 TaxID=1294264 RepID=A0ABR4Y5E5_9BACI|nr:hypothetical protein CD31_02660 [Lysinibacillus boronitolerans JCM 21713 = 10a = NBRC 103108]